MFIELKNRLKYLTEFSNYPKEAFLLIITAFFVILMVNIDVTAVNLIIIPITKTLKISLLNSHWIISSYLLGLSATMVIGGKLGDVFGHNKVFCIGVILFTTTSLIIGCTTSFIILLIFRSLQGIGAAILWPNIVILVYSIFPANKKGFATGLLASFTGITLAIGPTLGGYLASDFNWRYVFFINVPLGLIILFMGYFIKIDKDILNCTKDKLDILGFLVFALILICIVLNIDQLKNLYSQIYTIIGLILSILVFIIAFVKIEKKVKNPLIDLSLFNNQIFMISCLIRAFVSFTFYLLLYIMGLYLQQAFNYTTIKAGLIFLPMTLVIGLLSPIGGKLIDSFGKIKPILFGLIIFIITYFCFAEINQNTSLTILLILFTLPGLGYGIVCPGLLALALSSIDDNKSGVATGFFYMATMIGGLLGISVTGTILGHYHMRFNTNALFFTLPIVMWISSFLCIISLVMICYLYQYVKKYEV